MNAAIALLGLAVLLVLGAGIIALQIFLSKKENKWAGLVLPIISFLLSLVVILGLASFGIQSGRVTTQEISEDGKVISEVVEAAPAAQGMDSATVGVTVYLFVLSNIPTAVLLAIYFVCRPSNRRGRELRKMSAQDLG